MVTLNILRLLLNVEIHSMKKGFCLLILNVKDSMYRSKKIVVHAAVGKKDGSPLLEWTTIFFALYVWPFIVLLIILYEHAYTRDVPVTTLRSLLTINCTIRFTTRNNIIINIYYYFSTFFTFLSVLFILLFATIATPFFLSVKSQFL